MPNTLDATNAPGPRTATAPFVAAVEGVSVRFGATMALTDVTLAIRDGESRALVGRNGAGKSTLVGVLTGVLHPGAGAVRLYGEPAPPPHKREKWRELVACVYQKPTVIPSLTVAENLFLNAHPGSAWGTVNWKRLRERAIEALEQWGVDIDPDRLAADLTVDQRQIVEITRALLIGARFIILDEPTARLEAKEIARLFERIRQLKSAGVTFLYISHHLQEIYDVCERVTVLRDGRVVADAALAAMSEDDIVRAMVSSTPAAPRAQDEHLPGPLPSPGAQGDAALRVRNVSIEGWCQDITFDVQAGQIVGLAGLAGSGKGQLADAIVGLRKVDAGSIAVAGHELGDGHVDRAIAAGVGYVPEDRHARGFVPFFGVDENATLSILGRLGRWGLVDPGKRSSVAARLIDALEIVASSPRQQVSQLSGGNQQKCVMARALVSEPKVLVLVNPTSGVDVASKQALFGTIRRARANGAAVLIVSDDLQELSICESILVMFRGRLAGALGAERTDEQVIAMMEGVSLHG